MAGALTQSITAIKQQGLSPVISEIKLRTPRDGDLLKGRSPIDLARRMARCSLAGLSVVTESESFGGSVDLLQEIAEAVDVPVLQKDFIRVREQIAQSKELGASAVLLIAGMLEDATLIDLQDFSHTVGLETVVEVHTEKELQRVRNLCLHLDLLGINNRDITVLETDDSDVTVTEDLLRRGRQILPAASYENADCGLRIAESHRHPPAIFMRGTNRPQGRHGTWDVIILSESSLQGTEDVRRAFEAGADGVLLGTAVMKAQDVEAFLWELIRGEVKR